MKNIFLFLVMTSVPIALYAQAENNNWYYGDLAGITFNTNPPSTLLDNTISEQLSNGSGSVSDKVTGEILFITDGSKVWDEAFQMTPNTNTTDSNNNRSPLVVPSISNRNQYFIFTTYYYDTSGWKAFCYSLMDMTLNSGLGDVISTQRHVVILDENGNPFPVYEGMVSQAITVTPNDQGNAYWVLYPFKNKLYAYKIDSSGFNPVPVVSNLTFTNNQNDQNLFLASIKVSPGRNKVGIASRGNIWSQDNAETRVYEFDSASGSVDTSNEIAINNLNVWQMEFSPNSNILFYNNVISTGSGLDLTSNVLCYDLINDVSRIEYSGNNTYYTHFQRTPTNEIYFGKSGVNRFLSKFTSPNNYNTTITNDFINMNPDFPSVERYANLPLPQMIPKLDCALYEELKGSNITAAYSYQVSDHITTTGDYTVNVGQNINLYAGNYIELRANSHLKSGAVVLAKIQTCPVLAGRMAFSTVPNSRHDDDNKEGIQEVSLIVYPNPVTDQITVSCGKGIMSTINIVSAIDNKNVLSRNDVAVGSITLDISDFSKGIYVLSVEMANGTTMTSKIVKK